jgi:hypothetical protein
VELVVVSVLDDVNVVEEELAVVVINEILLCPALIEIELRRLVVEVEFEFMF